MFLNENFLWSTILNSYLFFLLVFVWVVMPIHFEEYHGSSIRHSQWWSNTYCILLIHCSAHISCDDTVFYTQISSCNSISMTHLYTLQSIFILLCCTYILIAHLSSFSCSQLGTSVDCTTCRFQMTNSIFKIDASFVTITDDNNYNSFLNIDWHSSQTCF